jgi:hypothetical protein
MHGGLRLRKYKEKQIIIKNEMKRDKTQVYKTRFRFINPVTNRRD